MRGFHADLCKPTVHQRQGGKLPSDHNHVRRSTAVLSSVPQLLYVQRTEQRSRLQKTAVLKTVSGNCQNFMLRSLGMYP